MIFEKKDKKNTKAAFIWDLEQDLLDSYEAILSGIERRLLSFYSL